MRMVGLMVLVVAGAARAEQWADEPQVAAPSREQGFAPRLGFMAGLHLGTAAWIEDGPLFGARVGVRARMFDHLGLNVQVQWGHGLILSPPEPSSGFRAPDQGPDPRLSVHLLNLLAGVDLFTTSAFEALFIPELSVSLLGGIQRAINFPGPAVPVVGLELQMLRLWPSRWWFPVYLQMLFVGWEGLHFTHLVVGVGL